MIYKKQIVQRQPLSNLSDPSLHPLINRIYANRGIKSQSEIDYSLKHLPKPNLLIGMQEACEILYQAALADANVLIVGDYDVDGATSTALTKLALEAFGFNHVAYLIPDRMTFGYGLSTQVVEVIQALQPDVLITVDNGISSHAGVKLAHDFGITVIITDHHLPTDELPQADAIVNPNLVGDPFPAKSLAGVAVAFYLMLGLRAYLRHQNWFIESDISEPSMADYLELVALGTIADLVPFDYTNRLLVDQGLRRIRHNRSNLGIKALLDQSGCNADWLTAEDIAFKIAPKINAAGRLQDMSMGVECLLSQDYQSAQSLSQQLDSINQRRKNIQESSVEQALYIVEKQLSKADAGDSASICLYDKDWHPGIVGLIASKLKETLNLPSVVFAPDSDYLKGSARSIPGIHIRDTLVAINRKNPGLIERFGGHAMAAGLTLKLTNFDEFTRCFEEEISNRVKKKNQTAVEFSDGQLAIDDFELATSELLNQAGPWGMDFAKPKFDNNFKVVEFNLIGDKNNHLKMKLHLENQNSKLIDAVAFNVDKYLDNYNLQSRSIHALYSLDTNRYNNAQNLQIIIDYFAINSNK